MTVANTHSWMLKVTSCGRNCHYPSINCLFSVFSNINGEHESTLMTSKKYSWCIPVQKEIKHVKLIIWGAAITPEPWNRQQCWFIFQSREALREPRDNKAKAKLLILKNCQKFKFGKKLYMRHLLKLLDKMYKYEMDPTRTLGATAYRADTVRRTDGRTDGRSETNIPPNNFLVQGV